MSKEITLFNFKIESRFGDNYILSKPFSMVKYAFRLKNVDSSQRLEVIYNTKDELDKTEYYVLAQQLQDLEVGIKTVKLSYILKDNINNTEQEVELFNSDSLNKNEFVNFDFVSGSNYGDIENLEKIEENLHSMKFIFEFANKKVV